jgi:hypothetical protein
MAPEVVDMPAERFIAPSVSRHSCGKRPHRSARVGCNSPREKEIARARPP